MVHYVLSFLVVLVAVLLINQLTTILISKNPFWIPREGESFLKKYKRDMVLKKKDSTQVYLVVVIILFLSFIGCLIVDKPLNSFIKKYRESDLLTKSQIDSIKKISFQKGYDVGLVEGANSLEVKYYKSFKTKGFFKSKKEESKIMRPPQTNSYIPIKVRGDMNAPKPIIVNSEQTNTENNNTKWVDPGVDIKMQDGTIRHFSSLKEAAKELKTSEDKLIRVN